MADISCITLLTCNYIEVVLIFLQLLREQLLSG